MAKFKEGDKVVIVRNFSGPTEYNIGDIVSISMVHDIHCNNRGVAEYSIKGEGKASEVWCEDELELYKEHKPELVKVVDELNKEISVGIVPKEQPMPTKHGQTITLEVIRDLLSRDMKGQQTYGESLHAFNGRDSLLDAYEEALDLAQYLKQCIIERANS